MPSPFFKKRMTGGVVFGPPAWMPERIEDTFATAASLPATAVAPPDAKEIPRIFPAERLRQIALLQQLGLARTCATIPSLAAQLAALAEGEPTTLVLNLLPTQPEYALPAALVRLAGNDLVAGLEALAILARRIYVAFDRHDAAIRRFWKQTLRTRMKGEHLAASVTLAPLLNRYPQGQPTILLRALTRARLPVGALPPQVGAVILDAVTPWALGRWLRTGQPLTDRPVQLFDGLHEPRLVLGHIGEPLERFCASHGVATEGMQIILNGMLAGREVAAAGTCIETDTESVTLRERPDAEHASACIACGWCVDVCPTALEPIRLMQVGARVAPESVRGAAETAGILESRDAREAMHCIGCGLCSYVCPTRLPLMHETLRLRGNVAARHAEGRG